MNSRKALTLLFSAFLYLVSADALAQEPIQQIPSGFMVEGLMSASVYTTAGDIMTGSVSLMNAAAVPSAVIGYRAPKFAIGLGIGFFRTSSITDEEDPASGDHTKTKIASTSMLFQPRFEISLFRSQKAAAEAYLALAFGAGFNVNKMDVEMPAGDDSDTDSGVVLGTHVGLGGRCFFGGGPFALGMEFGWSGLFLNMKDNEDDTTYWQNILGVYGALVGTFVFG